MTTAADESSHTGEQLTSLQPTTVYAAPNNVMGS